MSGTSRGFQGAAANTEPFPPKQRVSSDVRQIIVEYASYLVAARVRDEAVERVHRCRNGCGIQMTTRFRFGHGSRPLRGYSVLNCGSLGRRFWFRLVMSKARCSPAFFHLCFEQMPPASGDLLAYSFLCQRQLAVIAVVVVLDNVKGPATFDFVAIN